MPKRYLTLDMFRALCTLEIIAYWHLGDYVFKGNPLMNAGYNITIMSLAGFSFISGLLNGNNTKTTTKFYESRLQRFFLPFVLSYFCLINIGLNVFSLKNCILTLSGFSGFSKYQPYTLWFISDLMLFYLATPWLTREPKIKRSITLYVVVLGLYMFFGNDYRLVLYLFFYLLGLNLKVKQVVHSHVPVWFVLFSICIVALTLNLDQNKTNPILQVFIGLIGIPMILFVSSWFEKKKLLSSLLLFVSYASMFAYFFHRFLYFYIEKLLSFFLVSDFIKTPILVASVFIICYGFQKGYNKILEVLKN